YISIIFSLTACSNSEIKTDKIIRTDSLFKNNVRETKDTITNKKLAKSKLSVIVLPPYDEIANEGISPDIQKFLETEISKDTNLTLIKFPYKQLMNIPYSNVFDKKYCKPIADKLKVDIIVMSKIIIIARTNDMTADIWSLKIKIYNPNTGIQINSSLTADNSAGTGNEIKKVIADNQITLTTEIKNNH
ncbi:MAG: hypothetical protein ACXVPU_09915, partial [Bacteroidia bacterium]